MPQFNYYIYSDIASRLLQAIIQGENQISLSLDLNISNQTVAIDGDQVRFDSDTFLHKEKLEKIDKMKGRIFLLNKDNLRILEYRGDTYYKLVPTPYAPTVEIDGIQMHRTKDFDPFVDAELKVKSVVKKGDRVLDTCGGLGYTAIWASRLGAREVISVEQSNIILELRKDNPWSAELNNKGIKVINDDVGDYIQELPSQSFDCIIHDPPRISLAGHLYGELFYAQLKRVLNHNSRLFHYTGNPHVVRHGSSFINNVITRLKLAGFKSVSKEPQLQGLIVYN